MRMSLRSAAASALLALWAPMLAAPSFATAPAPAAAASCDRSCLQGLLDTYLQALAARDPGRLPLTADAEFTENGQHLLPGEGLWKTASAIGTFRMQVADPAAGRIAFLGSIREDDIPAMLAAELVVRDRRIAGIETLVQRSDKSAQGFEKIGWNWSTEVPAAERLAPRELVRIANMYFSGMQQNDGRGDYPFADDCNRIENGTFSTNVPAPAGQPRVPAAGATRYSAQWSCLEQFRSGLLHFVTRIRDRRFVAADPEHGVVFAFAFFDHAAGDTRTFSTPDGRTVTAGPRQPWTWEIAEAFQIERGRIHQIQAIMERVPYGMNSGWSTWEQGRSDRARYPGP